MPFCKQCGNQLKPGARFCGSCGVKVVMAVPSEVSQPTESSKSRMNVGRTFLAFIVAVLLCGGVYFVFRLSSIIGTRQPQLIGSNTTESFVDISPPPIPTVAPEIEPAAPKPQWASIYLQCMDMLGESKDVAVEKLGVPDHVFGMANRYDYKRQEYQDEGFKFSLYFDNKSNQLNEFTMTLLNKPSAREVWEALSDGDAQPLYYKIYSRAVDRYWLSKSEGNTGVDDVLFTVNGYVRGREIQLNGRIAEPTLKADKVFSTETDGYVLGEYYPNPNSSWEDSKIFQIYSQPADSGPMGEIYGEGHYIGDGPNIKLGVPASTIIDADIIGSWQGIFGGDKADLEIQKREDNLFWGELMKHEWKIAIQGVLSDDGTVSFKGTKVIAQPAQRKWTLGVNTGKFSDDKLSISGFGNDSSNPIYGWYFTKKL